MVKIKPIEQIFNINGIYSAFRFDWSESFAFIGESHNFWEAVFVTSGEVEVTEDENVYVLGEGDLIFHAPMEFHRIKSAGGSCPKGFIFSFSVSGELPEALRAGIFTLEPSQAIKYSELFDRIQSFFYEDPTPFQGQEIASLLSTFFIKLSHKQATTSNSASRSSAEYRRIVSYMLENARENLNLSDIATATNVSVSYIKLLFNTYAGISPKVYFNQLRVRHATELLNSGMTVSEVAYTMNFSSPNYFSSFYKKQTGISPSEVQKG